MVTSSLIETIPKTIYREEFAQKIIDVMWNGTFIHPKIWRTSLILCLMALILWSGLR